MVPGMPLADARALAAGGPPGHDPEGGAVHGGYEKCGLATVAADPAADRRALAALADGCGRYTPWTAVDGDGGPRGGGLWLDITGCTHLFGGEGALIDDLVGRLDRLGFAATAAVADTMGAAWAVARFAGRETAPCAVVPSGEAEIRRVLAPLPVAGLRLPAAVVDGMARVGLRRIGDLYAVPRAPLAARFGDAVVRRLDQALGRVREPLSPRRPPPAHHVRLAFADPIGHADQIAAALGRLLGDLRVRLEHAHKGVRRLDLTLYRVDGTHTGVAVGTARPVRDAAHLERLFADKLEQLDPGFGVEVMVLAATTVDPLGPQQDDLDGGAKEARDDDLARLVDRLGNRLGPRSVVRLAPRASHVPERACRPAPALAAVTADGEMEGDHRPAQPRPLRLLPWPEPIEAVAPVPDHPPVLFRWRGRPHRVARAAGPERIAPEWWRDDPGPPGERRCDVRDYYRVEDADGRRFWVYREGLYRPDRLPRWYLHGLFA